MVFAGLILSIYDFYVVLFLELDLLTSIFIITIIVSSRNFLQIFLRVPLGTLSQIIGRKPLIIFGIFCYTIALGLLYLATSWFLVLLATGIVALGMGAFWPALFSSIGDISQDRYGEINGRFFQGMDLGTIIGSAIAVILLDGLASDLRDLFGLIFFLGLLSVGVLILVLPESLLPHQRTQVDHISKAIFYSFRNMFSELKTITLSPGMKIIYVWQLIIAFVEFMVTAFYPVLVVSQGLTKALYFIQFFYV